MPSERTGTTRKKDSNVTAHNKPKVEWQGYVTFELNEAHKKGLDKAVSNENDPLLWLPKIAIDGVYEIKTKWDTYNNCWVATIYCSKFGHENAGWALPARAANYWDALRRVAYVHLEVLKEGWHVGANDTGWKDEKW